MTLVEFKTCDRCKFFTLSSSSARRKWKSISMSSSPIVTFMFSTNSSPLLDSNIESGRVEAVIFSLISASRINCFHEK